MHLPCVGAGSRKAASPPLKPAHALDLHALRPDEVIRPYDTKQRVFNPVGPDDLIGPLRLPFGFYQSGVGAAFLGFVPDAFLSGLCTDFRKTVFSRGKDGLAFGSVGDGRPPPAGIALSRSPEKSKVKTMCSFVRLLRLFAPAVFLIRAHAPFVEHNRHFVVIGPPRLGGELRVACPVPFCPPRSAGKMPPFLRQNNPGEGSNGRGAAVPLPWSLREGGQGGRANRNALPPCAFRRAREAAFRVESGLSQIGSPACR